MSTKVTIKYHQVFDASSKLHGMYVLDEDYTYYSERYKKFIKLKAGYVSDGATGAWDIYSAAWWVHDKICIDTVWSDGTPITAYQASMVLHDILQSEGRYFRSKYWMTTTFSFGCHETRKNGWFTNS